MSAMIRHRTPTDPLLLDIEAWEAPFRLSDEDLYAEAGADLRFLGHAVDEREDDR